MRIHRDRIVTRLFGTALGAGFVAIGAYALLAVPDQAAEAVRERAAGFGVAAVVIGVIAIAMSWLAGRLDNIWCAHPDRFRRRPRVDEDRDRPSL